MQRSNGIDLRREIEGAELVKSARRIEQTLELAIELPNGGTAYVRLEASRRIKGPAECETESYLFDDVRKTWWLLPRLHRPGPRESAEQALSRTMRKLIERREALQYLAERDRAPKRVLREAPIAEAV